MMVSTTTKPLTLEEFLALPETKPASEYIKGQAIQKPMPLGKHSLLRAQLINGLMLQGIATTLPELRCTFAGNSIVPDLAIFKTENIPKDDQGEIADIFDLPPDWIIEILSPSQNPASVIEKILHCLESGTEVGWLIDPTEKSISIYHSQHKLETVKDFNQSLIVPGFAKTVTLNANNIFSWLQLG
jgi:Uma2 family endonuclease